MICKEVWIKMNGQLYIGIDLGTSAVKMLLVDEKGAILNSVSKEYPLIFPAPGWCEQEPKEWWRACTEGIHELLNGFDAAKVAGIGCGGQMHGLVVLDKDDNVIRKDHFGIHRQYRLCRLHRAQAAVDAGERARKLCPHRQDHAAQGLYQL